MNKELANILKGKLLFLPWADLVAGMSQVLVTEDLSADNSTTITHRRPVTYDAYIVGGDPCQGQEVSLVPDSTRKSIIYFEDGGIASDGPQGRVQRYTSSLRLIAWLDRSKLVGDSYAEIAGRCQSNIISLLCHKNPENIGMFTRLRVDVARIPPQEAALFSKYTYDETDKQYLRPPFEFFGIDLICSYAVPDKCLAGIPWGISVCS